MKRNYQQELDAKLESLSVTPKLLLHVCCAPCASYVLEYLTRFFDLTLFFYNPNITDIEEYHKRAAELTRLVTEMPLVNSVRLILCPHEPELFYAMAQGRETLAEGGARCFDCYRQRLCATAQYAAAYREEYAYFATTLTVSPHKNAQKLNEIGEELAKQYQIEWLPSDFKKRDGYKRSIELSAKYELYRQNYCGCEYSRAAALKRACDGCGKN